MVDVKEVVVRLAGRRKQLHILDVVAITDNGEEVPVKWRVENFGQVLAW